MLGLSFPETPSACGDPQRDEGTLDERPADGVDTVRGDERGELERRRAHALRLDVQKLEPEPEVAVVPGLEAEVDSGPKSFANFDLFLNIRESAKGLCIDCDYNSEVFDEATIARWLGHYETLLAATAGDMDRPVAALPLLNEDERSALLVNRNQTEVEYSRNKTAHQLFEEQAARTPRHWRLPACYRRKSTT